MLPRTLPALRQHGFRSYTVRPPMRPKICHTSTQASQSRIARLEARLPAFLRRFTVPLRTAPVSHITAFLLLHEITAIVPLFGLTALFHYFNWLPPWMVESAAVKNGVEKLGRYFRKKGWIDDGARPGADAKEGKPGVSGWFGRGEMGVRVLVEFATAYAITKFLIPVRILVSVWAAPVFARSVIVPLFGPIAGVWKKVVGSGAAGSASRLSASGNAARVSPAAGTNAVGGGVLSSVEAKLK